MSDHPKVVAEVGCNHRGDLATALRMIDIAAACGADVVKFQKRNPRECLSAEQYAAPHPVPGNAYGATYGEHREALEFDAEVHERLMMHCAASGIEYGVSVWDMTSAREMVAIGAQHIKVPSALNTHVELLEYLRDHYDGDVHCSLGMTTDAEREALFALFARHPGRLVPYACTSGYPVPFEDVNICEVDALASGAYGGSHAAVGFSGHHLGIAIDMLAVALGASWIERHFTLDRTWKGTDHAASLEPAGLRKLCRDVRAASAALTLKPVEILDIERPHRTKLKYRSDHGEEDRRPDGRDDAGHRLADPTRDEREDAAPRVRAEDEPRGASASGGEPGDVQRDGGCGAVGAAEEAERERRRERVAAAFALPSRDAEHRLEREATREAQGQMARAVEVYFDACAAMRAAARELEADAVHLLGGHESTEWLDGFRCGRVSAQVTASRRLEDMACAMTIAAQDEADESEAAA